jgi:PAS domain S-box-containing protein
MKQAHLICRDSTFPPLELYPSIAVLRTAYPCFYRDLSFREGRIPVIIAEASLPGLSQIMGRNLPPVIVLPDERGVQHDFGEEPFALIASDCPASTVRSFIRSAIKYTGLLQRYFGEMRNGRETLNNLNEVIYSLDLLGNIIYISSVIRHYHLNPEAITGRSLFEYIHPEDRETMKKKISDLAVGDSGPAFFRLIDGQGSIRFVKTSCRVVSPGGRSAYITGVMTDRTEQSRSKEQILKLTQAVEQSANVIVITDLNGNIEFVNRAFELLTGYSKAEVLGKNPNILKTDYLPDTVYENLWKTITSGNVWEGRFFNKRRDGSTYWEKALISPIKNETGGIINFIAVKEDITKELARQSELERAKEMAEEASGLKSEFLANMSHEIRTPLNVILGFTDLLLEKADGKEVREQLGIIKDSGVNLLELINDILDFSKIEAGKMSLKPEPFSLFSLLHNLNIMFSLEAESKGLSFSLEKDGLLPEEITGDQFRIRQILLNLLSNAVKFTEAGSVSLHCTYDADEEKCMFTVKDTGIGIAGDLRGQIFKPFEQLDSSAKRRFSGTGLGLSITRKLVYLMAGTMNLESEPGKGSVFTVTLPLKAASKPVSGKAAGAVKPAETHKSRKHILVAEDNAMNQILMRLLLERIGHECTIAGNGKVAVDMLRESHYDLLLLDMQMPVMDGMETLEAIRKDPALSSLPVIALTASAMKGDAERFIEAGCDDYLSKPIDRLLLEEKLASLQ